LDLLDAGGVHRISRECIKIMYDIVIIGSGPAGANLARLIGEKYKVLLIDKRDLENHNKEQRINKNKYREGGGCINKAE
jgi:choline dehydrogenase-like flavoprotein